MRTTENFGFQIPEEDEFFDIGYVAHNMDILDEEVKNIKDAPINDEAPTYEEATELTKLSSGEKLSIALGKIAKAVSKVISHIETAATSSILGHVKVTTGNGLSNSSGNISMSKGTGTDYGAIKLSDKYNSKVTNGAAANSIGASQNALYEAYNEITNNLAEIPLAINTSKILVDTTRLNGTTNTTYTATEKCFIEVCTRGNNGKCSYIAIDDVNLHGTFLTGTSIEMQNCNIYPVKKGQTIKFVPNNFALTYRVFGSY